MSCLRINMHKSSLVGVGMDSEEVHHIFFILGCQTVSFPMRYLGLQLGVKGWTFRVRVGFLTWCEVNLKIGNRNSYLWEAVWC